jgi:hypothetical protein
MESKRGYYDLKGAYKYLSPLGGSYADTSPRPFRYKPRAGRADAIGLGLLKLNASPKASFIPDYISSKVEMSMHFVLSLIEYRKTKRFAPVDCAFSLLRKNSTTTSGLYYGF